MFRDLVMLTSPKGEMIRFLYIVVDYMEPATPLNLWAYKMSWPYSLDPVGCSLTALPLKSLQVVFSASDPTAAPDWTMAFLSGLSRKRF